MPTGPPSLPSLLKHMSQPLDMEGAQGAPPGVGGPLWTERSLLESGICMDDALLGSAAEPGGGLPAALTGGSSAEVWDRLKALRTFYVTASGEGTQDLKALSPENSVLILWMNMCMP